MYKYLQNIYLTMTMSLCSDKVHPGTRVSQSTLVTTVINLDRNIAKIFNAIDINMVYGIITIITPYLY